MARNSAFAPRLNGAHYDTVIAHPYADDNAAAVAIALQASSILREAATLERDLIVAIFDAEKLPYFHTKAMGSNRFYEDHIHGSREIHAVLVMDLVGHDVCLPVERLRPIAAEPSMKQAVADLRSTLFVTGTESHPELAQVIPTLNS